MLTLKQEGTKKKSKHFGRPKRSLPPPHSLSEFYLLKNGHVGVTPELFLRAREKGYFVLSCLQVKGCPNGGHPRPRTGRPQSVIKT